MSCPACFIGHPHEGKPMGKMIKLHGLDTYVVEPQGREAKGTIVIIPDAFGIDFVNNKLLADIYATKGPYRVYLPDFMLGRSCPAWLLGTMGALMAPGNYLSKPYHFLCAMYGFLPWIYHNRPGRSFPIVKKFFEAFRKAEGSTLPVGVAGFCWGGKHTVLLTHRANYLEGTKPMLDAAFTGHPSFLSLPADVEAITVPTSFALAEKDNQVAVPKDSDAIAKIVEGKPEAQRGVVRVYMGAAHGFCVRADPTGVESEVVRQAREAEDQAVSWFNAKLGIDTAS